MKAKFLFLFVFSYLLSFEQQENILLTNTSEPKDLDGNFTSIPFFGEKLLVIFYTDPDVGDVNDYLSNLLMKKTIPESKFAGIGIVNCDESWIPNSAIRIGAVQKLKKYPGSIIILDEDNIIQNKWNLKDCNNMGVVIIVGKDKKIKLIKYIKTENESISNSSSIIKVIDAEIEKM